MLTRLRTTAPLAVAGSAVLVLASAGGALAATATSTMVVGATVVSAATVTATPMVFGNYNPTSATGTNGTSSIVVAATAGTPYTVGIDAGQGAGATVTDRKMTAAAGTTSLTYSVYKDEDRTAVWGNSGSQAVTGTGTGLGQTLTAYGKIPTGQGSTAGVYADTLTVTVTY